ncbi:hypothetical protein [Streptomyces venezuelae]|uniref:hypothetical protein n=1 Tax=Streptomyces venezuelae TaxID=54571 RepID=UPI0036437B55
MLKARPDLHYAPIPGGVYFSGARAQFVLRGSEVLHAVAQGCVPLLEDGTDEDALVAEIGTERARPAVRLLVDKLRENGLLLDPAAHTAPEPPAAVRERHTEALARLEGLLDDPYGAFARLRAATVLVTGPATATGPAVRGLRRAGIGTVLTGTDGPAGTPDAVLDIREDDGTGSVEAPLVVPVLLGGPGVTLVGPAVTGPGPAVTGPGHPAAGAAFRGRARAWAAAESTAPAPRPMADALAGALGAQLLVDVLTGTADPGEAHVVHGTDLVSDRVSVEGAHLAAATGRPGSLPETPEQPSDLGTAPAEPRPEPDEARETATPLAARWTGLLALTEGADLPQMPLALRAAELRSGGRPPTTVLAWAAHQETATVAATLAALRALIPGAPTPAAGPSAHIPGAPTPAAGLTREHWLLDGALRLLAEETRPLPATTVTPHVPPAALPAGAPVVAAGGEEALDPEGLRILAALRRLLGPEPLVRFHSLPGLGWRLAEVTADGARLARAWGADAAEAARNALCTALARTQTSTEPGTVDPLSTDALLFADRAALDTLRADLAARSGTTYRGTAVRHDPVLGELPLWYGPVEAHDAH